MSQVESGRYEKMMALKVRIGKLAKKLHKLEEEEKLDKIKRYEECVKLGKLEEDPRDKDIVCPYHKTKHEHPSEGHAGCIDHGHCLNPVQCSKVKYCPMHAGGQNMFLAWSASKKNLE